MVEKKDFVYGGSKTNWRDLLVFTYDVYIRGACEFGKNEFPENVAKH